MHKWGSAVAVALIMMLAGGPPAAAAMVTINTKLQGDTVDIRASAMLNADAATAWRVLTDYDHYAEFIPDLRVSRVVGREGNTLTVEQSGDAAIWLFKMPVRVTFEVNEMPPNSLQSRTVADSGGQRAGAREQLHAGANSIRSTPRLCRADRAGV